MILFSLTKLEENIFKILTKKYNNIYMTDIYCVKCKEKHQQ